ncbi:MAG TPA: pirin family protein [Coriobacteriia bacterium]|nr:pirin family protein [Coriobacteriia bacterium]
MTARKVALVHASEPTLEGAGVHLRRAFGFGNEQLFDPFLMMDDFRGDNPAQYSAGFPWHPHRGIETITYMLEGECDHSDSMGNEGTICAGDVQWMTAGSGIIHQEMPRGTAEGRMGGFQLWANLPASHKMRDPRYQGVEAAQIPEVVAEGARVRVVAGRVGEVTGPVEDVTVDPEYLDVSLGAGTLWTHPTPAGHTVFAYVFEGEGRFGADGEPIAAGQGTIVLFGDGDEVLVTAGDAGVRFVLISGKPLGEPIAWRGPIVMNTREELAEAWHELDEGTFVKHHPQRW